MPALRVWRGSCRDEGGELDVRCGGLGGLDEVADVARVFDRGALVEFVAQVAPGVSCSRVAQQAGFQGHTSVLQWHRGWDASLDILQPREVSAGLAPRQTSAQAMSNTRPFM